MRPLIAFAAALLIALAASLPARAQSLPWALYTAQTIVTGTGAQERPAALARCLRADVVKLTGNPALANDPRLAADIAEPSPLVEDYVYLDRMTDIPTHDEQGTRQRPFDLVVHFAPGPMEQLIHSLGATVWTAPRPPVVLIADVVRGEARFPLSADGIPDERMRRAALEAADRSGLRLVLVPLAALGGAGSATPATVADGVLLHGTLTWDAKVFGWVADWTLRYGNADHRWGASGVSFDDAFRDGLAGAARILSAPG